MQAPPPPAPPARQQQQNNNPTTGSGSPPFANNADWQERERRQRSVRMLMLFLFCLLLMDEEPDSVGLRGSGQWKRQRPPLEPSVFTARRQQDTLIRTTLQQQQHPRYTKLIEQYNHGMDRNTQVQEWSALHADMVKDEFPGSSIGESGNGPTSTRTGEEEDPEANTKVWHYPWNTTGFYRGDWKLIHRHTEEGERTQTAFVPAPPIVVEPVQNATAPQKILPPIALERPLTSVLRARNESVGLVLLPPSLGILTREDNNLTGFDDTTTTPSTTNNVVQPPPDVSLTRPLGRAAFQLYSRHVPALRELSLVDGFIKLYDNTSPPGYSTRKDMLLRVRGVHLHAIGRLSLVANVPVERVALVLATEDDATKTTQSLEAVENGRNDTTWSSNHVLPFPFVPDDKDETVRKARTQASHTLLSREQALEMNAAACAFEINLDVTPVEWTIGEWRKLVVRRMQEAQQLNPFNRRISEEYNDATGAASTGSTSGTADSSSNNNRPPRGRRRHPVHDQALAMHMTGTIHSPNCNFTAVLNTTAIRTDWDATTSKSINYSFYLMLVCLSQILLLLRQLLHSQSPSAATRVSLLCIGWHTIIDALLCLAHIYLSLAVPPLFTAFASVAFFKLLIFCVIEMKYMAMILQARNSGNGGQPADVLRRQVAMLHLRFYVALLATFLVLFYADHNYRSWSMLALYSFWVPQIVWNVITEARQPMHKYYIVGMSLTRLVAPCYIFCVKNNFLKEVYPDSPTDPSMMIKVSLWVLVQAAVLLAQGKYGARCMIPARFLPPKFDYNRPLPASMLPPDALDNPTPELIEDRENDPLRASSLSSSPHNAGPQHRHNHPTNNTTRNRHNKSSGLFRKQNATMMTMEEHNKAPVSAPVLECSICYEAIDVRDRKKYMLGPCNHLFHKECLAQWMDVKMECPICRTALPAL